MIHDDYEDLETPREYYDPAYRERLKQGAIESSRQNRKQQEERDKHIRQEVGYNPDNADFYYEDDW